MSDKIKYHNFVLSNYESTVTKFFGIKKTEMNVPLLFCKDCGDIAIVANLIQPVNKPCGGKFKSEVVIND